MIILNVGKPILIALLFLAGQGVFFIIAFGGAKILEFLLKSDFSKRLRNDILGFISYVLSFLVIIYVISKDKKMFEIIINSFNIKQINLIQVVLIIILPILVLLINVLLNKVLEKTELKGSFFTENRFSIFQLIFVILIAPISEEIIFRSLLYQTFTEHFSILLSILLSSILFAVFHIRIRNMLGSFFGGLAFSFILYLSGSIVTTIVAHSIYNGLSMGYQLKVSKKMLTLKEV